jgi:DNA-binding PadR family transcriptional regulator
VYAEARRLTTLGYLSASREPGRTRPRTVYALTPRGLEAFRTWARTPATYPRIQHETAVRFLGLDLVEQPSQLLPALDALDEEITALEHHVNTLAERGASIPHRRLGISLQLSLAQKMLIAHREWLLEARTALAASVKL